MLPTSGFNNSSFKNKFYLQTERMAQGPNMSCSYSDIVVTVHDEKTMNLIQSFDLKTSS